MIYLSSHWVQGLVSSDNSFRRAHSLRRYVFTAVRRYVFTAVQNRACRARLCTKARPILASTRLIVGDDL